MSFDPDYWSLLERRYDGPIPVDEMDRADYGLEHEHSLERANGRRLMWSSQLRRHIRRIRKARQIAGAEAHLRVLEHELRGLLLYCRGANRAYWSLRRGQEQ